MSFLKSLLGPRSQSLPNSYSSTSRYHLQHPHGQSLRTSATLPASATAASRVSDLGRILTFSVRTQFLVNAGGKYFETPWRKQPTHQGGFLLDGGVHFVAGLRLMLGKDPLVSVSANTAQLQPHLPPVDTIAATARTKSGAVGTISLSFGTTASNEGTEIMVGCEEGWVGVKKSKISSGKKDGETKEEEVQDERSGVPPEIRAWGCGIELRQGEQGAEAQKKRWLIWRYSRHV